MNFIHPLADIVEVGTTRIRPIVGSGEQSARELYGTVKEVLARI
jgi:hypothetical protein